MGVLLVLVGLLVYGAVILGWNAAFLSVTVSTGVGSLLWNAIGIFSGGCTIGGSLWFALRGGARQEKRL